MKTTSRFAIAAAAGLVLGGYALQARAADLGGDCCADLEERVAELEATTARKGNRVVSLTISGHVNKTLMIWDDGFEENVYVTDNNISQSRFRFTGSAKIDADVSAGFFIEVSVADNNSSSVKAFGAANDQLDAEDADDEGGNNKLLETRHVYWWLKSERLGKLSLGHQSQAADGLADVQLGNTVTAASSGWNNNFNLFTSVAGGIDGYSEVEWGNIAPIFHGGRGDFVRYDSPSLHGFVVSATWGEDDTWDVTLRYAKEWNSIRVAAAVGYAASSDGTGGENLGCINTQDEATAGLTSKDADCNLWAGSVSLMHVPTGLFVAFAAGEHTDDGWQSNFEFEGGDPAFQVEDSGDYWYVSGGIQRRWWSYGSTTFYGEYLDSSRSSLGLLDADDALNASGADAWINGADYSFWGIGVVQAIDAAAMEFYVMYRDFDGSIDLVDANGDAVDANSFEDMSVVFAGARIKF